MKLALDSLIWVQVSYTFAAQWDVILSAVGMLYSAPSASV